MEWMNMYVDWGKGWPGRVLLSPKFTKSAEEPVWGAHWHKHGSISVTERVIKTLRCEWLKHVPIIKNFDHLTMLCVKSSNVGIIPGDHTWHWMVFDLMMSITRKNRRNRSVIQKGFRAISNNICSRRHGSLGIALRALRSLCFSIYQTAYSTRGRSIDISYTKAPTFAFSLSLVRPRANSPKRSHFWIFQRDFMLYRFYSGLIGP